MLRVQSSGSKKNAAVARAKIAPGEGQSNKCRQAAREFNAIRSFGSSLISFAFFGSRGGESREFRSAYKETCLGEQPPGTSRSWLPV